MGRDHELPGGYLTGRTADAEVLDKQLMIGAITQLSVAHREVIRQAYYLGRTTRQIAADLSIPDSLVKSRLHYALQELDVNVKRIIAESRP